MADFKLDNMLISESSFLKNPQDELKNATEDYSSIFGNFSNDFLNGINVMHSTENLHTPFAYNNVMQNIYPENYETNEAVHNEGEYEEYYSDENYYDDEFVPGLEFEC